MTRPIPRLPPFTSARFPKAQFHRQIFRMFLCVNNGSMEDVLLNGQNRSLFVAPIALGQGYIIGRESEIIIRWLLAVVGCAFFQSDWSLIRK